ncbi:DNA recombination protein RmuC [Nocardioides limicola]|uniref:DNA recombination protein RmuC n=1 Tax=Nocardioides limicola TaxID=2803368 RepID=UPI00193BA5FD|nr:DNA recombination protein RmuC [Nocardioides sp. DJM-14]
MDTTTLLTLLVALLLVGLGLLVGYTAGARRPSPAPAGREAELERRAAEDALLRDGIDRLDSQLRHLQRDQADWQGQFVTQVRQMVQANESLRVETQSLAGALRRPEVRGRWGEMHLRRTVEVAGLVDHCDFREQQTDSRGLRPDLVVHLAGGRQLPVDAKVPLTGYLDALESDDADERAAHLARHVRHLRTHIDQLGSKAYWRELDAPEFVVLFLPAEAFLSGALERDGSLIEYAADRQVVLATPSTLIALLRTVAHGWRQHAFTEEAERVRALGVEMHDRLGVMAGHLDGLGRSLNQAVGNYNSAVGSLESRVLVTARRFAEMGVTEQPLPSPRLVDAAPRSPTLVELPEPPAARRAQGA